MSPEQFENKVAAMPETESVELGEIPPKSDL